MPIDLVHCFDMQKNFMKPALCCEQRSGNEKGVNDMTNYEIKQGLADYEAKVTKANANFLKEKSLKKNTCILLWM